MIRLSHVFILFVREKYKKYISLLMIIVFIQIGVHLSPLSGNEKATYKELVTTKHFSC